MSTPTPTDLLVGSVKELLETIEPSRAADAVRTALDMLDGGMTVEPDPDPDPDELRDIAARLSPDGDGRVVYRTFDLEGGVSGNEVLASDQAIDKLIELLEEEDIPLVAFREDEPTEYTVFFPETPASESFIVIADSPREVDDGILVWKTATGIMNAVTEAFHELPLNEFIVSMVNDANES